MAEKGTHYLAIPVCRLCHERLGNASLEPSRDELLELIVINLICYMGASSFLKSNEAYQNRV
jgi:hypothetical protein